MRGLVFEKVEFVKYTRMWLITDWLPSQESGGYCTCESKLEMWNRFRSRFYFQENKV